MSRTWEEQRDEICRLNDLALDYAKDLIDGTKVEEKGRDKNGDPIYTEVSDGIDILSKCSTIAKQWMSELRQSEPVKETTPEGLSDDQLARKARKAP